MNDAESRAQQLMLTAVNKSNFGLEDNCAKKYEKKTSQDVTIVREIQGDATFIMPQQSDST